MTEVTVIFDGGKRHTFSIPEHALAAATADEAHRWLDEQWTALGCAPVRPTGKVLVLDKILGVARNAGEERFAARGPWAESYARTVSRVLERSVTVDVAASEVG
jgi:hypothetical protein